MADPTTKAANLQRTYTLTVPLHDLMGDAPTVATSIQVTLARADGVSSGPLFGPQGLVVGGSASEAVAPVQRDATMISEGTYTFTLLPSDYFFVPVIYLLSAAGRVYQFAMPARDASIIALLDAEAAGGDDGGGASGVAAQALPDVESIDDATELANAQSITGRAPIFARVTADFATWEAGDVLVWQGATDGWALLVRTHTPAARDRGLLIAWWGAGAIPAADSRTQASIRDSRPAVQVSHDGTGGNVKLNVAYPNALDAQVEAILVDGAAWTPEPLLKGVSAQLSGVAYRLYSSRAVVDVSGGVGPLSIELVLRTP